MEIKVFDETKQNTDDVQEFECKHDHTVIC